MHSFYPKLGAENAAFSKSGEHLVKQTTFAKATLAGGKIMYTQLHLLSPRRITSIIVYGLLSLGSGSIMVKLDVNAWLKLDSSMESPTGKYAHPQALQKLALPILLTTLYFMILYKTPSHNGHCVHHSSL